MPDNNGQASLSWTSFVEREEVMKLLLGWEDVNADGLDNDDWTLPPRDAEQVPVYRGMMELLSRRKNIHPDTPDKRGRTSLTYGSLRYSDLRERSSTGSGIATGV